MRSFKLEKKKAKTLGRKQGWGAEASGSRRSGSAPCFSASVKEPLGAGILRLRSQISGASSRIPHPKRSGFPSLVLQETHFSITGKRY